MNHRSLRFLERALLDLRAAHTRLSEGHEDYFGEMRAVTCVCESIEAIIKDIQWTDEQRDPEAREERAALAEMRRPYVGGTKVWGA